MVDACIVLTIQGEHANLSRKDAQWLSEHLPTVAALRTQLRVAGEQDLQGGHIDVIEISLLERDAVKQAILEARGRSETVPENVSTLERIL